jgi:DNA repair protein RadD
MILYPHQNEAIQVLWNGLKLKNKQLCVLPTGSGKSLIIYHLMKRARDLGVRSCVLLNREVLCSQFAERFFDLTPSIYSAALGVKDSTGTVTIASIQSCFKKQFKDLKLIIVDEAHGIGEEDGMYDRFLKIHPDAKIIGFTATPYNNRGYIFGADKFFPKKDYFKTLSTMISDGFLVPPTSKSLPAAFKTDNLRMHGGDFMLRDLNDLVTDRGKASVQVQDALSRLTQRKKCIWVCVSIEHAEMVLEEIARFERASLLHSKQTDAQKFGNRDAFEKGDVRHMVSVMMLTEGYDFPAVDSIVMLRPTRSAKLYVQTIGRGLRNAPGKRDCLFLDYGEVIINLGSPNDPLIKGQGKKFDKIPLEVDIKICPGCFTMLPLNATSCGDCGHEWDQRDLEKNLKKKPHQGEMIKSEPKRYWVDDVSFGAHVSAKGNKCVRVDYTCGITHFSEYFSEHPYSWGKGRTRLKELTGWDFSSHTECYAAANDLLVEKKPVTISVEYDGKFPKVKSLNYMPEDIFVRVTDGV